MQQELNNNFSGNLGKPPYNNNAPTQQMMNQSSTNSADPKPSQKKKKNTRNKDLARSMFNPNAPRITLESFFTGYSANSRSNVEVEFDHTVVDRVDELYCQQTQAHCDAMNQSEVQTEDKMIDTKLVNRCSLFKKLVVSTPQSSQVKIQKYVSLSQPEIQAPPSISALYDCVGKTDEEDFTIRIKDNIYTIHNLGLDIAKVFLDHSSNKWKYSNVQRDAFRALEPWKIHFGDDASTQRLRSLSNQYLNDVYDLDFELTLQSGTTVSVSYPRLQISEDQEIMVDNFVAWINKLSEEFPNIEQCITAGLLCIAQTFWFKDVNLNRQISELLPIIEENSFRMTPQQLLDNIGWRRVIYQDAFENNMYMELLCDAFAHLSTASYTNLSRIFVLTQQPHNPFGNRSQLIYHSASQHRQRRSALSATGTFSDLRENAYGTSLTRLPQKQLASLACIFGLTTNVRYKQIYESRLNANIVSVRAKYVSGDFKPIS